MRWGDGVWVSKTPGVAGATQGPPQGLSGAGAALCGARRLQPLVVSEVPPPPRGAPDTAVLPGSAAPLTGQPEKQFRAPACARWGRVALVWCTIRVPSLLLLAPDRCDLWRLFWQVALRPGTPGTPGTRLEGDAHALGLEASVKLGDRLGRLQAAVDAQPVGQVDGLAGLGGHVRERHIGRQHGESFVGSSLRRGPRLVEAGPSLPTNNSSHGASCALAHGSTQAGTEPQVNGGAAASVSDAAMASRPPVFVDVQHHHAHRLDDAHQVRVFCQQRAPWRGRTEPRSTARDARVRAG